MTDRPEGWVGLLVTAATRRLLPYNMTLNIHGADLLICDVADHIRELKGQLDDLADPSLSHGAEEVLWLIYQQFFLGETPENPTLRKEA